MRNEFDKITQPRSRRLHFGQSSDIYQSSSKSLHRKYNVAQIVNELLVFELFQLSNGDFIFFRCMPTEATNSVLRRNSRITHTVQVVRT